jgi:peptidoglycan/LPS O-acetylase OafA/YrhL
MSTLLATVQTENTRSETEQRQRIPALDGWRGVAILLVLLEHVTQYSRFKYRNWANLGSFGVDIFFVLSGYIITARLMGSGNCMGASICAASTFVASSAYSRS